VTTSHGQKRWQVIIPKALAGGKLRRKFFTTKEKAVIYANSIEAMRRDCRNGYDMLHLQERAVVGRLLGKLEETLTGDQKAIDELSKAVEFYLLHNPKSTRLIPDLVQEFIEDRQRLKLRKRYIQPLRNSLLSFSLTFKNFSAEKVTPSHISEWLMPKSEDEKRKRQWASGTIETHLKNLRAMFSYAHAKKYVPANPALSVEPPKTSRVAPQIFTPEDAERLMRSIECWDPGLIRYVSLIMFGGLRPEESEACRPEFARENIIDLPSNVLKNNKRRLVELRDLPTLRAWLDVAPEFSPRNLRKRMDVVREATKVKGDPERIGPVKWGHDILRKCFVSYSVPIIGVAQTALAADHSESVLKTHYRELVTRAAAERFWQILPK
jgi:hypothetical protein